nr:hypothetical protein [Tanacetum cinerariifolium]
MDHFVTQKKEIYQVVLDIIKNTPCYNAFIISANVPEIYMQQFLLTIKKAKKSSFYQFDLDNKSCQNDVELFQEILDVCPKITCINLGEPLELSSTDAYRGRHQAMTNSDHQELKFVKHIPQGKFYGKPTPDTLITNEIKISEAYKTFFGISTGLIHPKKGREGEPENRPTSRKKRTPRAVVIQEPLSRAIKASKHESRLQHQFSGSSEGAGMRLEVSDELTGKFANSDEGADTSPEVQDESKDKSEARDDLDDWGSTDD